jgi:hypothetical protein
VFVDEQRITLWRTAWGVVLAASGAFTVGYGASHAADPSIGASRPPVWPLFISVLIVAVSLWFVLAPTLHRWPFEPVPGEPAGDAEPWLAELSDADQPNATVGTFRIEGSADEPRNDPPAS